MHNRLLAKYQAQLTSLNRGGPGRNAPYKPLLLLSVIQLIGNGTIRWNRIRVEDLPDLQYAFQSNWLRFLDEPFRNKFVMPFYHMSGEPFWEIITLPGRKIGLTKSNSIRSYTELIENLDYVRIDPELFELLSDPVLNLVLEETVLDRYFPHKKEEGLAKGRMISLEEFDAAVNDHSQMPIRKISRVERERIVAVRNAAFVSNVKHAYHYRCAVSGLVVQSDSRRNYLVEACHIRSFSDSLTESISNGIALSPTLHKAFDAGLFTIDDTYKVIVSSRFSESASPHNLKQFSGQQILLPSDEHFFPSRESLEWHRDVKFDSFI
jgi:putative restriction endonuclease